MVFKNLKEFKGIKDKMYGVLTRLCCNSNTLHLNYLKYVTFHSNPFTLSQSFFHIEAKAKHEKYKLH